MNRQAPQIQRWAHPPGMATRELQRGMCSKGRDGRAHLLGAETRRMAWWGGGGNLHFQGEDPAARAEGGDTEAQVCPGPQRPVPLGAAALVLGDTVVKKPVFCCSASLARRKGVGHILCQQRAKPIHFPPTTIKFSEGTPRGTPPLPGTPTRAAPPRPPRQAASLPGTCPPRRARSLAAWTQTALPPEHVAPNPKRPGPRRRPNPAGCGGAHRLRPGQGPPVCHPSERGTRTPNPGLTGGGEGAPGCPGSPHPARDPPEARAPGRSRSRARARARGGLLCAAMRAARCGRAPSLGGGSVAAAAARRPGIASQRRARVGGAGPGEGGRCSHPGSWRPTDATFHQ